MFPADFTMFSRFTEKIRTGLTNDLRPELPIVHIEAKNKASRDANVMNKPPLSRKKILLPRSRYDFSISHTGYIYKQSEDNSQPDGQSKT